MVLPGRPLYSGKQGTLLWIPYFIGPFSDCTHLRRSSHWGQRQVPNSCIHLIYPTLPSTPCPGYPGSLKFPPRCPQACFQGLCGPVPWICRLLGGPRYCWVGHSTGMYATGIGSGRGFVQASADRAGEGGVYLRLPGRCDAARGEKFRDVELFGSKVLNLTLASRIIMIVWICHVW